MVKNGAALVRLGDKASTLGEFSCTWPRNTRDNKDEMRVLVETWDSEAQQLSGKP
jgi:hypothetical protein